MLVDIYHLTEENVEAETKVVLNDHMNELNKILTTFIRVENRREFSHKLINTKTILLMHQKLNMIR